MKTESTITRVFDVLKSVQLQGSNNISHNLRYSMEQLLALDPKGLSSNSSGNIYYQRPTEKFTNLMRDLCQSLQKLRQAPSDQTKRKQRMIESKTIINFFSHMIELFSQMSLSTYKTIRVFGARTLFMVLHSTKLVDLADDIHPQILKSAANCVLELLRQKQTDYKKCGIKLASTMQIVHCSQLKAHIEAIVYELLKIISTDDNQQLRLLAVKNLVLKQSTLKQFFLRLRDKSPDIRVTVFKKLIAEKIAIHELGLANLYKVFYDGVSSREVIVKQECINCFSYYLQPAKDGSSTDNRYLDFLNMFSPNVLLHYPHLYTAFCELTSKVLETLPESQIKAFQTYLRTLCINFRTKAPTFEIFYIRIASFIPTYSTIVEEHYMTGVEQAAFLEKCFRNHKYFEFMEALKLVAKFINIDEKGRNDIFNTLTEILRSPNQHIIGIPAEALEYENDICGKLTQEDIERMRVMHPYYYEPIIHNTEDLVVSIVRILKDVRPDSFCNELQQLISDIRPDNPENNLIRQWEMLSNSIDKLKAGKKQPTLIKSFEGKRAELSKKITILKSRIVIIMRGLLENSNTVSQNIFKSIIALSEGNRPLEILLTGLYGLVDIEKAKNAFSLIWRELKDSKGKLCMMVAIRVGTDLIIKFNLRNQIIFEDVDISQNFSHILCRLMFSEDCELRAIAIESMCKLLYHQRVENFNLNFVYILMLWWDTKTEEGSARSVHVISTFIKQYIEKSAENFRDMSYLLQVYFRTLNTIQSSQKVINKNILKYTLKFSAFIKRSLQIAMTILRYTKLDGSVRTIPHLRKDKPKESIEIGPQQSFIMFLLKEKNFESFLDSALENSDCLKEAPAQVLKLFQIMIGELNEQLKSNKCKQFMADIERRLSVKGQPSPASVKAYQEEFQRQFGLMTTEVKQVFKNINELGILTTDVDEQNERDSSNSSDQGSRIVQMIDESSSEQKEVKHQSRRRRPAK